MIRRARGGDPRRAGKPGDDDGWTRDARGAGGAAYANRAAPRNASSTSAASAPTAGTPAGTAYTPDPVWTMYSLSASWQRRPGPGETRSGGPAVPASDQQPRRKAAKRVGERRSSLAVPALNDERRRLGCPRPGVDAGQVDGNLARLRLTQLCQERVGPLAGVGLGAYLALGVPPWSAQEDRAPAIGDCRGHRAVAGDGARGEMLAPCPARGLVKQGVLIEVRERGEALGWRAVAEHREDRWREDFREV